MPIRDEKVFSDEEMIAAFEIILPPEEAREEGLGFNSLPDLHFENPPRRTSRESRGWDRARTTTIFWTCSRSFRTAAQSAHGGSWAFPPRKANAAARRSGAASTRRGARKADFACSLPDHPGSRLRVRPATGVASFSWTCRLNCT
jgi:hypothetical protein